MEHEHDSAQGLAKERRRKLRAGAKNKGQMRSPVRLVLAEWTICVTNVPLRLLSVEKALILAGARWQIELLFNLRKQQVQIDEWCSYKPWAILCEVLAKLMAMVFLHWLLLLGWWQFLDRSLVKASQAMRTFAPLLTFALGGLVSLSAVVNIGWGPYQQILWLCEKGSTRYLTNRNGST